MVKKWKIASTSFPKKAHRADPELWECVILRINGVIFFWEGGGNGFLEKMFLLYVLPSFAIKNMKKIVIEQISKKVENSWNSIQKFCKTLSFQKFVATKIDHPQKLISSIKNLFNVSLTELEIWKIWKDTRTMGVSPNFASWGN